MMKFREWLKREEYGPYIGGCKSRPDFQVSGACSDRNSDRKNKKISNGSGSAK